MEVWVSRFCRGLCVSPPDSQGGRVIARRRSRQIRIMAQKTSGDVRNPRDGLGLLKPLTRDVQWIAVRCSLDGHASVNGLRSAIQWMEWRDSMDRTSLFNGLRTSSATRNHISTKLSFYYDCGAPGGLALPILGSKINHHPQRNGPEFGGEMKSAAGTRGGFA